MMIKHLRFHIVLWLLAGVLATPLRTQPRGCFGYLDARAGTVEFVSRKGGGAWQAAQRGMCLFEGAGLRTGSRSGALVTLDDGSAIRLNENSEAYFVDVPERFLLSRLSGMSLLAGEAGFDLSAGYDDIFVETLAGAAVVQGASATLMIRPAKAGVPADNTGMSVFVLNGAVHVFDVYLNHRVTAGPGQQTNVIRLSPPQSVIFFHEDRIAEYVKYWVAPLKPGADLAALYAENGLADTRARLLGCPPAYYSRGLWCCPDSCKAGPSGLPADMVCADGTYYIGNRMCCDNACR